MSKQAIQKVLLGRFVDFTGLTIDQKGFENSKDAIVPASPNGVWAEFYIIYGLRKVASIGNEPCTRRTGVATIEVHVRKNKGVQTINAITDSLEDWFSFYEAENLWLDAARTVNDRLGKDSYQATVYVPFTYDYTPPSIFQKTVIELSPLLEKLVNEDLPDALGSLNA